MKYNILHTEWSNGWGGQEIRVLQEARIMSTLGHRVAILTVPGALIAEKARDAGVRVIESAMSHPFHPSAVVRIAALLRREKFDVVNTHSSVDSWLASMAAKLTGTPLLVRSRHLSVPLKTHPFNFVYRWPDGFITTAESIRRRMIEVNRMDAGRIISIPTGVDLERFDPQIRGDAVRKAFGWGPEERVVAMVAVLRSWKRHDIFLEVAARLAEKGIGAKFLIVGEGPYRPWVEEKIQDLGLERSVVMTGHRTDVPDLLAAADICVLTSESSEGVPQSVLQYQAMAKPVVATNVGGIPEIVHQGVTGILCPPKDSLSVTEGVERLLAEPEWAASLGRKARELVVKNHSLSVMAEKTIEFYEKLRP